LLFQTNKINIKEDKKCQGFESPRFHISYLQNHPELNKKVSYDIISRLNPTGDCIIELNSSLLNAPQSERETLITLFLESIQRLKLTYRHNQATIPYVPPLWEQLLSVNRKKTTLYHQIWTYIPADIWLLEENKGLLPDKGCRYYLQLLDDGLQILDKLATGQVDSDTLSRECKLMIFDDSHFGQMGLYSELLSLKDIKTGLSCD
jgi:hypothetical protein